MRPARAGSALGLLIKLRLWINVAGVQRGRVHRVSTAKNYHRLVQACPHCDNRAIAQDGRTVTRTTRELYFQCSNVDCGATFKSQLAIIAMISPSSMPHPDVKLPFVAPRRRKPTGPMTPANENQPPELEARA